MLFADTLDESEPRGQPLEVERRSSLRAGAIFEMSSS